MAVAIHRPESLKTGVLKRLTLGYPALRPSGSPGPLGLRHPDLRTALRWISILICTRVDLVSRFQGVCHASLEVGPRLAPSLGPSAATLPVPGRAAGRPAAAVYRHHRRHDAPGRRRCKQRVD